MVWCVSVDEGRGEVGSWVGVSVWVLVCICVASTVESSSQQNMQDVNTHTRAGKLKSVQGNLEHH